MSELVLRAFIDTDNEQRAGEIAKELANDCFGRKSAKQIKYRPYWKIPEYYEVVIIVDAGSDAYSSFEIAQRVATGWISDSEREAIWDGSNGIFNLSDVRWAHLEILEE